MKNIIKLLQTAHDNLDDAQDKKQVYDALIDDIKTDLLTAIERLKLFAIPDVSVLLPSNEKILEKAKEVISEDLYKDCSGYVTIEDRNERKRNILIQGIKIGLKGNEW